MKKRLDNQYEIGYILHTTNLEKNMAKLRMIFEIEEQVRNEFKAKCVIQGKTMRDVLTELMKNYKPELTLKGGGSKKK